MDNPERVTYFAATDARGARVPFGIKAKDRTKHVYVIGKTGMGKSTLLENMAIQDIRNGEGLAFIDPHGETANKLLDYIPAERAKDVVYFAPFDMDHPIAFNVMEDVGYDKRHLVVSGLMATFKKIWVDAWSARMEYILTNTLLALLEYPGATLLGVNRMYTDKAYRKQVVENVKDPIVKDFWIKEFATYTDRYTQEATPAIQNKIGQFTGNPLIRNIIGQPKSSFDIRDMMDHSKILIINLSKGQVGETNMRLLGSMLTTRIFLSAMSRADLHGSALAKLPNFYFYVDEFQNFANETFAEILSEARKYKLNLTIAHQYIEQMEEEVRDAVFGNMGTTICFRVGPFDAEVLETVFMPEFTKEDLANLGLRQIYLTLMIDGVGSRPFSAVTIPPIEAPTQNCRNEVLNHSRAQFATMRDEIEQAISTELAATMDSEPEPASKNRSYAPRAGSVVRRDVATEIVRASSPRKLLPTVPREETLPAPTGEDFLPAPNPRSTPPTRSTRALQPVRSTPPNVRAAPKTAEDLRSILRRMTADVGTQKTAKDGEKQEALKKVLQNTGVAAPSSKNAQNVPLNAQNSPPTAESNKMGEDTATPQTPPKTAHIQGEVPAINPSKKAPYEVPASELEKIFKEGI